MVHPSSMESEALVLDPTRPHPVCLFIWLFICILYNKLVEMKVLVSVMSDSLLSHGLYPPGSSIHGIFQERILE